MSTLEVQSTPDDDIIRHREQASRKDIHYATLENELDFLAPKSALDDALDKLRNETDRAVKLESDLQQRSEDLRAERVSRQNLEASLHSANEKLKSEELTSKHLETATIMSPPDEAVVARLLTAIERLRSERDALRRELDFTQVEHRVTVDTLQTKLDAAENSACRAAMDSQISQEGVSVNNDAKTQQLGDELGHWKRRADEADDALKKRTAELEVCNVELKGVRAQLRELRDNPERTRPLHVKVARVALASFIVIGRLRSHLEKANEPNAVQQLEVLEQRVLRRTEQIGMQQHDIKRLETNLRVAEDTIGELTLEVEVLGQEKGFLVEDCAQTRKARDDAHRRLETLEVELEGLTREHNELKVALGDAEAEAAASEQRIDALVHVIADSASRSRALGTDLALATSRLSTVEAALHTAEASNSEAHVEIERLASELETKVLMLDAETAHVDAVGRELSLVKGETQRVSDAFETFKQEVQSHEDVSVQVNHLTATVQELERRLMASQASEDTLSEELESTKNAELTLKEKFIQVEEDFRAATAKAESLSSTVTSLEEAVKADRLSHSTDIEQADQKFEARLMELDAQLEERRIEYVSLETKHAEAMQDLMAKNEDLQARLDGAHEEANSQQSLARDLRRLKDEHAEELLVFRSRLDESAAQIQDLQAQLATAADTIRGFQLEMETSSRRYEAAQVEVRGAEHALSIARAQLAEHDTSIQALQREKTLLQGEHTRLEAELEKSITKYQYLEQHARRSDQDILRLKEEAKCLNAEVSKFDEAAQRAEVNLSLKSVQFEQKLAMMQRELKKQQEHRHCQESIAELKEKNEYLEEVLRMKSVEIEENDDRFIEALKEKKRLNGKIENMARKIQNLQAKLAAVALQPSPMTPVALPTPRPKTPSPPIPPVPSAGPSVRPATRIPSSPAMALRAKTPEPLRSQFAPKFATPEPPVPSIPLAFKAKTLESQIAAHPGRRVEPPRAGNSVHTARREIPPDVPSSPLSSGSRKRRAPDDFDPPTTIPAQVVVGPSVNVTPRHLRRPTNDARSAFTPTRNGTAPPGLPQTSPSRRVTAPLSESTNSPRVNRALGLGKPTATKPPTRSWLSRSRPPTGGGMDVQNVLSRP